MPINWLINGLYAWWLIVRAFSSLPFASCPRDIPCGWPPWDLLGVEMQGYHSLDGVVSASGFIAACILLSWSSWQCQPLQRWWTSRKPSHLPGIALEFLGLNCFGHLIALPRLVQVLAFRMNLFEKKKKKHDFSYSLIGSQLLHHWLPLCQLSLSYTLGALGQGHPVFQETTVIALFPIVHWILPPFSDSPCFSCSFCCPHSACVVIKWQTIDVNVRIICFRHPRRSRPSKDVLRHVFVFVFFFFSLFAFSVSLFYSTYSGGETWPRIGLGHWL